MGQIKPILCFWDPLQGQLSPKISLDTTMFFATNLEIAKKMYLGKYVKFQYPDYHHYVCKGRPFQILNLFP